MFYILYGKDDYSCQQKLLDIKRSLGSDEMLAVNTSQFDGREVTVDQLKAACSAQPFLCSHRLVIVRSLLERFEHREDREQKSDRSRKRAETALEEWKTLATYVGDMPQTTVLILRDGDVNEKGNNPLCRVLMPLAEIYTFPALDDKNIKHWIQNRVTECRGTITAEAVKLLTELVGSDLWTLRNEIDKLLSYNAERQITEADVQQLTSYAREINVFHLVDAILERRSVKAQQLLHRLSQDGEPMLRLLSLIIRQFRLILRIKEMLGQKVPQAQIGSTLGLKPYSLEKMTVQARGYTVQRVKEAYHKLLETDIAFKTGRYGDDLAMELMIIELCKA